MKEIWLEIENTEGLYLVSNFGNVKSLKGTPKLLLNNINNSGYALVNIKVDGRFVKRLRHRLVAETFLPNPNNHPEVDHINEDKLDNRLVNLQWISKKDHNKKSYNARVAASKKANTGHTRTRGENSGTSKLKEEQVLKIRELYSTGNYILKDLALLYSVDIMTIHNIVKRKSWFHI